MQAGRKLAGILVYKRQTVFCCDGLSWDSGQMYDERGEKTWECELDVYGKVRSFTGSSQEDCPFRYQGQYEDSETGLYYNRFRYYDPSTGNYLSQDPIGLHGGMQLYNYVHDTNTWVDRFGLSELLDLVDDTHSQLDPTAQKFKTTAIGRDSNGNIFISSSDPKVPKVQEDWAKANGIEVIHSGGKDIHVEEALIKSNKGIVHIDASRGVCIDCENLMKQHGVSTDTPKTGKKSKKRIGGCNGH